MRGRSSDQLGAPVDNSWSWIDDSTASRAKYQCVCASTSTLSWHNQREPTNRISEYGSLESRTTWICRITGKFDGVTSIELKAVKIALPQSKDSYSGRIISRLEQNIFPWIGAVSIADVTAPELLKAIRRIEASFTIFRVLGDLRRFS